MKADIQEVFKTLYTIPYDHIDFDLQSESLPGEKRFFMFILDMQAVSIQYQHSVKISYYKKF